MAQNYNSRLLVNVFKAPSELQAGGTLWAIHTAHQSQGLLFITGYLDPATCSSKGTIRSKVDPCRALPTQLLQISCQDNKAERVVRFYYIFLWGIELESQRGPPWGQGYIGTWVGGVEGLQQGNHYMRRYGNIITCRHARAATYILILQLQAYNTRLTRI